MNVAGCFLIGLVATLADERSLLTPPLRLFLVAGVLGGFTTFSTFGMETWRLIEDGELVSALLNPLASMGFGMIALIAGVLIGRNVT